MEALLIAAGAAWAGFAVADPSTPASWVAGGAALALLTIAIGFNFRNQWAMREEIQDLKYENRVCRWQTGILVEVLNVNHIAVPSNFYRPAPEEVVDMNSPTPKRPRKRFTAGFEDDQGAVDGTVFAVILGLVALLVTYTAFLYMFIIHPLQDLGVSRKEDACVASLTADYFVAIKRALAAPPAPNAERAAAIVDLDRTAERIRDRVHQCGDGVPDDYTPSSVP